MCQRSFLEKAVYANAEDKENRPPNISDYRFDIGHCFKKKPQTSHASIDPQKPISVIQRGSPPLASTRVLGQSIPEVETIQRPFTAAGPKKKKESEYLSNLLKKNRTLGVDLCEIFKKKKANANLMVSGTRSPTSYEYPGSIFDTKIRSRSSFGDRRTEIEGILLKLLEEHREDRGSESKLFNKVAFIERAIKG